MAVELSDEEMLRYNRQIILRGFDFDGQEQLKASRVLVVGLGGLGCAAAQYLAAAGVGQLTLLDFDTVSLSNLQRQTLHSDATLGQPKVDSARDALARINPHVQLTTLNAVLEERPCGRRSPPTIWCSTVPITSLSATSLTRAVSGTKRRWFPARRFAWKARSAFLPGRRVSRAIAV
jgi:hypothetical protein